MQTKDTLFKTITAATAAIGIFALTGCLSTSDRSAGRVIDDKMITSKVKGALKDSPTYKFDDVKVATYKGVVQLSGFVDTDEQKTRAGDVVKRVDWVRDVVNNITIKPHDDFPTPTGRSTTGERSTDRHPTDATTQSGTYSTPSSTTPSSTSPSTTTTITTTPSGTYHNTTTNSVHSTDRSTNP